MRLRLLLVVALLLAAWTLAERWSGPAAALPDARPSSPPASSIPASPVVAEPASGDEASRPLRDVFRYADERSSAAPAPRSIVRRPPAPAPAPAPAPEPPLRMIGIVRQPGGLRAAIAIRGEVVLLKAGESAEGWTLVTVDDDGARLRGPDGQEEHLVVPE